MAYEGFVDYWSTRMSRYKPGSHIWFAEGDRCLNAMDAEFGASNPDRSAIQQRIHTAARRLWTERQEAKPADPTHSHYKWPDADEPKPWVKIFMFNNGEGEKAMQKVDWHKPLRLVRSAVRPGGEDPQVKTYKSGKSRVIWVDDRVYPVTEQGCAVADVAYPGGYRVRRGSPMVENVPEEKFFLGLARDGNGTYWLTDGGAVSERGIIAGYWAYLMKGTPHWIVDIRKSAEPPKPAPHDPKDWAALYWDGDDTGVTAASCLMTETQAKRRSGADAVVRVRTTPPPADTARYIQLYREKGSGGAWRIDYSLDDGGQEYVAGSSAWRTTNERIEYVHVKVRD